MKALLIENDSHVAELLETVIAGLRVGIEVRVTDRIYSARALVDKIQFDLIVTDWNLPDGSGLDFVKSYRAKNTETPVVMVSSRNDKQSVLQAVKAGIDQYISKPFTVQMLHDRLKEIVKGVEVQSSESSVEELLAESCGKVVQLPSSVDSQKILSLMERQSELSASELADMWRSEIGLTARLLDAANSSSFKRSGVPVNNLRDAISNLGVELALNQALALSMDAANNLGSEVLRKLAKQYLEKSLAVAQSAQQLALLLGFQPGVFQKAGILSRIGELAVLKILNQFLVSGGGLTDSKAEELVGEWAKEYGNKLKIQWKLPIELRDMIGAVHYLADGTVKRERLIMRAAALKAEGQEDSEEYLTLKRRIGIDSDEREQSI